MCSCDGGGLAYFLGGGVESQWSHSGVRAVQALPGCAGAVSGGCSLTLTEEAAVRLRDCGESQLRPSPAPATTSTQTSTLLLYPPV